MGRFGLRTKGRNAHTLGRVGDKQLMYFVVGMLIFGIIMVYDASVVVAGFKYVRQHLIWVTFGIIGAYVAYRFDYHKLVKIIAPTIGVTIISLVLVLLFGKDINGARRWFEIQTVNLSIQPSELAKITFIIYLSSWLSKEYKQSIKSLKESIKYHLTSRLGTFIFLLGTVSFLIILEPDLGTTVLIIVVSMAIYFVSGSGFLHDIGSMALVGLLILMGVLASILAPYRLERVTTFTKFLATGEFDEQRVLNEDYQLKQVLTAVGSGGLTGVGFGQSKQKYFYLVDITPFTDSIFAVYSEEFGFLGGIVLISAYMYFVFRGFKIAKSAPDRLGFLLATGITIWVGFQAFMHIASNSALIPLTGITLPFVSYGGSSTIILLTATGILLNISRFSTEENIIRK